MKFLDTDLNPDQLMLCNMIYHKGNKMNGYNDALDVIYKNTETNEKHLQTIENPNVEVFFTKNEYRNYNHIKAYIPMEEAYKKVIPYNSLVFDIAKELGLSNFVSECIKSGNFGRTKEVHKHPYVFGSDIDIIPWYRIQWFKHYHSDENKKPISKLFMDIETDIRHISGFPKGGNCPINAVTMVDPDSNTAFILLLRDETNPGVEHFENNVDKFVTELHDMFDDTYGSFQYKVIMYDQELELIKDTFKIINALRRDYVMIWNGMDFDIPFIIDRLKYHFGVSPESIMCDPSFKRKEAYCVTDAKTFQIANKKSYFQCSAFSEYVDQMILYAALRKAGSELKSYRLSSVSKHEVNDEKLDYTDEGSFRNLYSENYWKFVIYSIKDTLLQFAIERKVEDLDNIYTRSMLNCTQFNKCFAQTYVIKSRAYLEYELLGLIPGNNKNLQYGVRSEQKDEIRFAGASGSPTSVPYLVIDTRKTSLTVWEDLLLVS